MVPRASLTGFDPSPAGGSFLGFRTTEGISAPLSVVDASQEMTIQFYYTEYNRQRTAPGTPEPNLNIDFRINSTSPTSGTVVSTLPNFAQTGGTEGTWELIELSFVPADFGIANGTTPDFFFGSVGSPVDTFGYIDGLIVQSTEAFVGTDTDGDGIPDHCDLDSDNDGISDLVESGQNASVVDTDGDGMHDGPVDPATGIPLAAGGGTGVQPVDTDGDVVDDYLDLDSDNDGIADAIEAQPTAGYQSPSIGTDADGDGVVDTFDSTTGLGGDFTAPEDTDGDGTPDYLDLDSDDDGLTDDVESGLTPGADTNNDGIGDGVGASYADTDGSFDNPPIDFDNEFGDASEVAYREVSADLVTVKTLISGDATPNEGDSVTFQIEVVNNGALQATNVSLADQLPAGITYTADTTSQGAYNATTGVWTIGTLNTGAAATITLTGTVDVGEGGNTITNSTTAATGDQPDPSTIGDDLDEAVVVDDAADLVTVKTLTSGDQTPAEGDTVSFQIEVTNDGAAQATNVSLTDQLPAGITYDSSAVSQGNYNDTTGVWAIGVLDDGSTAIITLTGTVDAGEGGQTITNTCLLYTSDAADE